MGSGVFHRLKNSSLVGTKSLLQELDPPARAQLHSPSLKQNANSLNETLGLVELMTKLPQAVDRRHNLSFGYTNKYF